MQELRELRVRSQGQKDPLEEGMATLSSILAWRIPWVEEPGRLYSPLRYSLGFFINKQSMKCKMLCPVSLGAYFDLCCLAFNQWGLSLSLFEDFVIACILHLVGVLTDFTKAFKSEKPDWLGQLFFLVSVDNQLYLFICCSFDWSYKALKTTPIAITVNLLHKHQTRELVTCCVCVLVAQLCLTLWDSMDYSHQAPVHGILQARILEWVAIPFSRGSSWPRYVTQVSCIAGRFFTVWATREAHYIDILCASPGGTGQRRFWDMVALSCCWSTHRGAKPHGLVACADGCRPLFPLLPQWLRSFYFWS